MCGKHKELNKEQLNFGFWNLIKGLKMHKIIKANTEKRYVAHICLSLISLVICFMLSIASARDARATDYYVAKDGSDSGPGTQAGPWLTIQKAAMTLSAGDTVYVKAGTYNEWITINVEGNVQSGYITFRNYGNDRVIIDGTGFDLSLRWSGLIEAFHKSYIRIQGFHIFNAQDGLSILIAGGDSESENTSHVEILSNEITGHNGSSGIGCSDNLSHVLIENNEVHHCDTGGQEAIRISREVRYFKLLNNLVHNNSNIGIDCVGWKAQPAYGLIKNNICYRNGLLASGAHAIYVDGGTYITIEDNICFDNQGGIAIGAEEPGEITHHIIVRRNIIYNCWEKGILLGASQDCGRAENCAIIHNTVYNNNEWDWSAQIKIKFIQGTNEVKNNLFHDTNGSTYGYIVTHTLMGDSENVDFDYNCYYPSNGRFNYNGTGDYSFSEWQTITGMDSHSLAENPNFINAPNHDFQLQANSPCIDAGDFLTRTIGSGSGTVIPIEDARYFCDGYDGLFTGDFVRVGLNRTVKIVNVDYPNNKIIVTPNISWNDDEGVSLSFTGSKPDIGACEFASGTISGLVSDKNSGLAIPEATVSFNGYSTITNSTGKYSMILPIGNYPTVASKNGYLSQSKYAKVTTGKTTTLDLQLVWVASSHKIFVFPNPYIKGKSIRERISFGNLPKEARLLIYTLSGKLVKTTEHKDTADGGSKEWDISGIASGMYIYYIRSSRGEKRGKVSIVK